MPATIVSNDFIDLGTITSRSEDASYPDDNVGDYWHLKRRFRADDANNNDWLLKFDFGLLPERTAAVVLNDVNFDEVKIQGHPTDAWGAPDYDGTIMDISLDEVVNRYKVYIPIIDFQLRWMRIFIPAGAIAVGSYTTKWEVGSVTVLNTITEITKSTYSRTSTKAFEEIALPSGGFERVNLGEMRWEGVVGFEMRKEEDENVLWELNNMTSADPLIFYENNEDTSKAYLCLREDAYEGDLIYHGVARGNMVKFKELV